MSQPILKSGVRILRPSEYELLQAGKRDETEGVHMEAALLLAMRYIEMQRFQDNRPWFDPVTGFVFLPKTAVLKSKRHQLERWVKLSERGRGIMPLFLKGRKLPSWQTWDDRLKAAAIRSGLDPIGLGSKTMRKTYESWLMVSYPERSAQIAMRQGHDELTQLRHYLNMPFVSEDIAAIKPYVEGLF